MSKKSQWCDANAKCPFYSHKKDRTIKCEHQDRANPAYVFQYESKCNEYFQKFCCDKWKECVIARGLLAYWGDNETS